jgi:hypothetical protein
MLTIVTAVGAFVDTRCRSRAGQRTIDDDVHPSPGLARRRCDTGSITTNNPAAQAIRTTIGRACSHPRK